MSLLKISTNFADRTEESATEKLTLADTEDTISQDLSHFHGNHYHPRHNLQCLLKFILGWWWSAKNFFCCTATSVTVSIWYKIKIMSHGYLVDRSIGWLDDMLMGWHIDWLPVCFFDADRLFFIFPICWLSVWSKKKLDIPFHNYIHCFWFRFPWMQDDLDAPAASANEDLNKLNDDISQAGQVLEYIHKILCQQCLFIQTAHILDINNE